MKMERLDKLISSKLNITRTQAKALIKSGEITVNSAVIYACDFKCKEDDEIKVNGKKLNADKYVYIMQNKPKGVICASDGRGEKTIIDLLDTSMKRKNLFPAGRLDKDTTGFVLITDDGNFAHNILSPKKHINKTYIAYLDKEINESIIKDFESGVELKDEKLLPAKLKSIGEKKVEVEISQGIYHQIKRMFLKYGITVLELKRTKMGALELDNNLPEGESRYITKEELEKINS